MTGRARYRLADGVAWVDSVEGQSPSVGAAAAPDQRPEAWVAAVPDGRPLSLNGSGLAIWLACAAGEDGGRTADEIAECVAEAAGLDDVPVADVDAFLSALVEQGLVEQE